MGMSIDEVIEHERQKANYYRIEDYTKGIQKSKESVDEHEQIASWLELLKHLIEKKESLKINAKALEMQGYNKGVDDFAEEISLRISESLIWGMIVDSHKSNSFNDASDKIVDYIIETSKEIAEQLKKKYQNISQE